MNIILLILGVFLIMFSIIKITISLNNKDMEYQNEVIEHKIEDNVDYNKQVLEANIIEERLDTNKTTNTEEKFLFGDLEEQKPDFKEEYIDVIDTTSNKPNMTDEIINMYKEGLTVNEIAKRLKKGIREIEIILKINKIRE